MLLCLWLILTLLSMTNQEVILLPVSEYRVAEINGEPVKLYYIGVLAQKLNRTTVAVRMWENKGIIPKTWFRDKFGKRLYTAEQIEAIVHSADVNNIMQGRSIALTNFSEDCHNAFEELHEKYFGGK